MIFGSKIFKNSIDSKILVLSTGFARRSHRLLEIPENKKTLQWARGRKISVFMSATRYKRSSLYGLQLEMLPFQECRKDLTIQGRQLERSHLPIVHAGRKCRCHLSRMQEGTISPLKGASNGKISSFKSAGWKDHTFFKHDS